MQDLSRRCVLVVEDEALIAFLIEDYLDELGYDVAGPAYRLPAALDLVARGGFDLALLDINLAGQPSIPIAAALRERGIPFIFASAYDAAMLTPEFRDTPVLRKPFSPQSLAEALSELDPQ